MQITDPIADMLTRIRNAGSAKHETVDVPASKMKKSIAEILLNEGYIKNYQVIDDGTQGTIRITLKYLPGKEKAIQGLRRVSKPGLRVYGRMNTERTTSRKVRVGKVVSDKMDKTVVVIVEDRVAHKTYNKIIGRTYRLKAHDENNECGVGDIVRVMETRPLSKDKRWRVVEIVEKAK